MTKTCIPLIASALLLAALQAPAVAGPGDEARKHVDMAQTTISNFLRDPNMTWIQANLANAKGVLIVPKVVKVGFVFGGSGGRGVLLVRGDGGKWNGPAFYTVGTTSVGFQAGVSNSEVVMLVMTDKGVNSLLSNAMKLGGDASVAAGPTGQGANATVTEDIVSFSRSKGLYGGLNMEGSSIKPADDWNIAYYGKEVQPPQILLKGEVHNKQADKLIKTVAGAGSAKAQ
jgi:lipid-binding SYLF domain-containing protein